MAGSRRENVSNMGEFVDSFGGGHVWHFHQSVSVWFLLLVVVLHLYPLLSTHLSNLHWIISRTKAGTIAKKTYVWSLNFMGGPESPRMVHVETGRVSQNWMLVSIWVFLVENSLKAFTGKFGIFPFLCVTRTLTSDIVPNGQEELEGCTRINTLDREKKAVEAEICTTLYHIIEDLLLCYSISLCMYIGLLLVAGHPSQVKANRDPLRNM